MSVPATIDADGAARETWDAIVVGAGLAGASSALRLARRGWRTLLVDKKEFPRAKACGGCLGAPALELLRQQISLASLSLQPVESLIVSGFGRELRVRLPGGAIVSRTDLDAQLIRGAVEAGAMFLPGHQATMREGEASGRRVELRATDLRATDLRATDLRATDLRGVEGQGAESARGVETPESGEGRVAACHGRLAPMAVGRVILVADGLGSSSLATSHGAPETGSVWRGERASRPRTKTRVGASCQLSPLTSAIEAGVIRMLIGVGGYVGLARTARGEVNVAAALDATAVKQAGGVANLVARLVESSGLADPRAIEQADWRATRALAHQPARRAGEHWFALGDSAGYIEPFTGEGMAWALWGAALVVPLAEEGIRDWRPSLARRWNRVYHREIARRQTTCRMLASVLRSPWLSRLVLRIASGMPWLADGIARHVNGSRAFRSSPKFSSLTSECT